MRARVVVRGGGEMASAAARLLFLCGFEVAVLERARPLAVRRRVSFAEAVIGGACRVEGVEGRRTSADGALAILGERRVVPVVVDEEGRSLPGLRPDVIVDGRMAKRNLGTTREDAPLVIGMGPGFAAGEDVHAVVETERGPWLGRVLWQGRARQDTGRPDGVLGHEEDRVLRAPRAGVFTGRSSIGALVRPAEVVGEVAGTPVVAGIGGLLRGLLADGVEVDAGLKVGDVDPRGTQVDAAAISDKARAVAAGVLEAALTGRRRRG